MVKTSGDVLFNVKMCIYCFSGIACKNNTWGPGCYLNCHCMSGSCHQVNGTCESGCAQGWTGVACQELLPIQQSI